MATKQALPSVSACMESSIEMRLVAWGMVDDLKNERSSGPGVFQNFETLKFH